jgi:hypothetical protein
MNVKVAAALNEPVLFAGMLWSKKGFAALLARSLLK